MANDTVMTICFFLGFCFYFQISLTSLCVEYLKRVLALVQTADIGERLQRMKDIVDDVRKAI
jgi:hypothetical protein